MTHKMIFSGLLLAAFIPLAIQPAAAIDVTWNQSGYAGTWNTAATANWKDNSNASVQFHTGDDAKFPTFNTLGGGDHYTNQTIIIEDAGVEPNSIAFNPAYINYLHLTGGDISGTAGGIFVDSAWSNNQAQLWFERNGSYSFTGDVNVSEGNQVFYTPASAGTFSLGTGTLNFADVAGAVNTVFNYEPTAAAGNGTTLTNDVHVQSGQLIFNWGRAPIFTGDLILDGDIRFNSVGGGTEYFDWNGDVLLSGDRTIIGGVRDLSGGRSGGLHFGGEFTGPAQTLTLDFQSTIGGGGGLGMQATRDTGAWNVGNLVLTHGAGGISFGGGNTPNLLVATTNATDDHFGTLRANGGKVTIQNGAQLFLRKGTIDFNDLQGDATGKVLIDMTNAAYDVRLAGDGMVLSSAAGDVQSAVVGFLIGSPGQLRGDITVGNGGELTLTGQYNEALKHYVNPNIANSGNLKLLGGSKLTVNWGINNIQLNAGYEFQSSAQKLYLGDGLASTAETITIRGLEGYTSDSTATGTLFLGTDNANIIDDGNVTLRYESTAGTGDFNVGWSTLANIQAMNYQSGTISYQFRGGSAGTEFAPLSMANSIGAIGPTTGTVFTAASPTRLVTTGEVGFYNSRSTSPTGHRGNAGAVVVANGGTFDLVAAGTAIASTWTVNDGGSVSGIGTFAGDMTLESGALIAPGNSPGTLTIDGNLTLGGGSIYQYEFNKSGSLFDSIVVTGDLIANGTQVLQFTQLDGQAISLSDIFPLFTVSGTLANGLPNFLLEGTGFNFNAASIYQLGNQIFLTGVQTAVPEPNSIVLLLGLGLPAVVRLRRRAGKA
jgi:hypothetical protein